MSDIDRGGCSPPKSRQEASKDGIYTTPHRRGITDVGEHPKSFGLKSLMSPSRRFAEASGTRKPLPRRFKNASLAGPAWRQSIASSKNNRQTLERSSLQYTDQAATNSHPRLPASQNQEKLRRFQQQESVLNITSEEHDNREISNIDIATRDPNSDPTNSEISSLRPQGHFFQDHLHSSSKESGSSASSPKDRPSSEFSTLRSPSRIPRWTRTNHPDQSSDQIDHIGSPSLRSRGTDLGTIRSKVSFSGSNGAKAIARDIQYEEDGSSSSELSGAHTESPHASLEMIFDFGFKALFQKLPVKNIRAFHDVEKLPRLYPSISCIPEVIEPNIQEIMKDVGKAWCRDAGDHTSKCKREGKKYWKRKLKFLNTKIFGPIFASRCMADFDVPDLLHFLETLSQDYCHRCDNIGTSRASKDVRDQTLKDIEQCLKIFIDLDYPELRFQKFREVKINAHQLREEKWRTVFEEDSGKYQDVLTRTILSNTTKCVRHYYAPTSDASVSVCEFRDTENNNGHKLLKELEISFEGHIKVVEAASNDLKYVWPDNYSPQGTPPGTPKAGTPYRPGMKFPSSAIDQNGKLHISVSLYVALEARYNLPKARFEGEGEIIAIDRQFSTRMGHFIREFSDHTGNIISTVGTGEYKFDGYHVLDIATVLLSYFGSLFGLSDHKIELINSLSHSSISSELWQPINAIFSAARDDMPIQQEVDRLIEKLNEHVQKIYQELFQLGLAELPAGGENGVLRAVSLTGQTSTIRSAGRG